MRTGTRSQKPIGARTSRPGRPTTSSTQASDGGSSNIMEDLRITGWRNSKASGNPDGGRADLIAFLERKATGRSSPVKIRQSRVDGDALIITVNGGDKDRFMRLNNFTFAGVNLRVEPSASTFTAPTAPRAHPNTKAPRQTSPTSTQSHSLPELLKHFLSIRYDSSLKLLNLSALRNDPELQNIIKIIDPRASPASFDVFGSRASESKFFPALMKVADDQFTSAQSKRDAVQSVTLANNNLTNVAAVTALAQIFPDLKNLDLSNNRFQNLKALDGWRHKFKHLDHLVLSGNPLEQTTSNYTEEISRWYRSLRILNGVQFRSNEEVSQQQSRDPQSRGPATTITRTTTAGFDPSKYDDDLVMEGANPNGAPTVNTTPVQRLAMGGGNQNGAPAVNNTPIQGQVGGAFPANITPIQVQAVTSPPGIKDPTADQLKEQMCLALSRMTNMKLEYSLKCLEETGWNFDTAVAAFEGVRASLPVEAFI